MDKRHAASLRAAKQVVDCMHAALLQPLSLVVGRAVIHGRHRGNLGSEETATVSTLHSSFGCLCMPRPSLKSAVVAVCVFAAVWFIASWAATPDQAPSLESVCGDDSHP